MSHSSHKDDEYTLSLYRQGGSSGKVGYFKAAYVKTNYDELFKDFLEAYKQVIPFGVCVRRAKEEP